MNGRHLIRNIIHTVYEFWTGEEHDCWMFFKCLLWRLTNKTNPTRKTMTSRRTLQLSTIVCCFRADRTRFNLFRNWGFCNGGNTYVTGTVRERIDPSSTGVQRFQGKRTERNKKMCLREGGKRSILCAPPFFACSLDAPNGCLNPIGGNHCHATTWLAADQSPYTWWY